MRIFNPLTIPFALLMAWSIPGFAQLPPALGQPDAATVATAAAVKPILVGVGPAGAEAQVNLSYGAFELAGSHVSGTKYIPVVSLFTHAVITKLELPGEISESKAPAGLKKILLVGFSPKALGALGLPVLAQPTVKDGKRALQLKDYKVNKDYLKPLEDLVKLTQAEDGSWYFAILQPLPAGHYLITFNNRPTGYWDFDV